MDIWCVILPWGRLWRVDENRSSGHQIDLVDTFILQLYNLIIWSIQTSVILNLVAHYASAYSISDFAARLLIIGPHWSKPRRSIKGAEPERDFCQDYRGNWQLKHGKRKVNTKRSWLYLPQQYLLNRYIHLECPREIAFHNCWRSSNPCLGSTAEITVIGAFFVKPICVKRKSTHKEQYCIQ